MKVKITMLLILWAVTACAEAPVDPGFYAAEFYQDAAKRKVETVKVKFQFRPDLTSTDGKPAAGICSCAKRVVYLDGSYWDSIGEWLRRALVYHELGHCALGIGCTGLPHPINGEIMRPALAQPRYYEKSWSKLVNTLFEEGR